MATSSTTYSAKWAAGDTKVIRVPERFEEKIMAYARALDDEFAEAQGIASPSLDYVARRLVPLNTAKPINVASVPLRSPFRYPGGKTWLVPYVRAWMASRVERPSLFLEPFAGGAICGLTVAFEGMADHVLLAETDRNVAAVWRCILSGQAEALAQRILSFDLDPKNVRRLLSTDPDTPLPLRERAFVTILRNRVQRGGIMAPGAGLVKAGENGKGIASRWYPETLARRIRDIDFHRHLITFQDSDGMNLIEDYAADESAVIFADPPYTKAARRLYVNWEFDHERLFEMLGRGRAEFLISYDDTEEVRRWAGQQRLDVRTVQMKNTHHARKCELLIGRDLSWLDRNSVG